VYNSPRFYNLFVIVANSLPSKTKEKLKYSPLLPVIPRGRTITSSLSFNRNKCLSTPLPVFGTINLLPVPVSYDGIAVFAIAICCYIPLAIVPA
jgi:hypothetical protein